MTVRQLQKGKNEGKLAAGRLCEGISQKSKEIQVSRPGAGSLRPTQEKLRNRAPSRSSCSVRSRGELATAKVHSLLVISLLTPLRLPFPPAGP